MRSLLQKQGAALVVVLLVSMACKAVAQSPQELQPPDEGDEFTVAYAINHRGEIAGSSGSKPIMWDRNGAPKALPLLDNHVWGEAYAINKRGEVAGIAGVRNRDTAVVWDRKGMPGALEPPEGTTNCRAYGINDRRNVVGHCQNDDFVAVRWDRKARPKVLPLLEGATDCVAYAINKRGKAAGTCWNANGARTAVLWGSGRRAKPKALLPLEGLEAPESEAFALNNRGNAVGYVSGTRANGAVIHTAVAWTRRGVPEMLQMPPATDEFEDGSEAQAINDRGEIAGRILRGVGDLNTAVVWDRKGRPVELQGLDESFESSAWAINNRRQVAGISEEYSFGAVLWDLQISNP